MVIESHLNTQKSFYIQIGYLIAVGRGHGQSLSPWGISVLLYCFAWQNNLHSKNQFQTPNFCKSAPTIEIQGMLATLLKSDNLVAFCGYHLEDTFNNCLSIVVHAKPHNKQASLSHTRTFQCTQFSTWLYVIPVRHNDM